MNIDQARIFARVCVPFLAGYFLSYLFRSINAVIGPHLTAEFSLTPAELGMLTGAFFLAAAVSQIPFGFMLDRYGPRRVDAALLTVAGLGAAVFALSTSFAGLVVGRLLIGCGLSMALLASFKMFSQWYPPNRLSTMNGVALATGGLGGMASTVPVEVGLGLIGWRGVCIVLAASALLAAAALVVLVPERDGDRSISLAHQVRQIQQALRTKLYWRVSVCVWTSQAAVTSMLTLWMGEWFRQVGGLTNLQASVALLLCNVAFMLGFIAFGRIADRQTEQRKSGVSALAWGVGVANVSLGAILLLPSSLALWWWLPVAFFGGTGSLGYSILAKAYPKEMTGRVNATMNAGVFASVFLGQWLIGALLGPGAGTREDAQAAFQLAFGVMWAIQLLGLCFLCVVRDKPKIMRGKHLDHAKN